MALATNDPGVPREIKAEAEDACANFAESARRKS